jgi:hypothetical protein
MAKETAAYSAFADEQGTIRSEMRNQIRRTEEDSMEMGTMEWALPNDHIVWMERPARIAGAPTGIRA